MTLSQRLTRAGLSFIVFGTAVSLMPTNGMAFSATDGCTTPAQSYSVGTFAQDPSVSFTTSGSFTALGTGTKSVTLNKYLDTSPTTDTTSITDSNIAFTTLSSGSTVTTSTATAAALATDLVTVTFPGGHVVTYTVTAN